MSKRQAHSLSPLLGFHGCDRELGESILAGKATLAPSENGNDWLGKGIYFWVDSPERGLEWATANHKRIKEPFVIGAFIYPGLCLNLTDYGVKAEVRAAYDYLKLLAKKAAVRMPSNSVSRDGITLSRKLDFSVISTVHKLREVAFPREPYDTVYGLFEEGPPLYRNAGIRTKTHAQIAVINTNCIIGYFRP